ncbi:hypothetical protein MTP02_12670 [Streptomyces albus]|uniref:Uncharacterized protein n=1 Tax=Streptomyces albidoflavus TaxID=1886 RepID=A0AA37BV23_9ACTN|nr:hypothetical protein MTP02_12670 [Streptomyces albus]GHI45375.1 hypothetical protein ScoT_15490 [Streptomyces albidoflavus]
MDLPEPFGPTTQVIPGSKRRVVAEAKDLNPRRVMALRCTPSDFTARRWGRAGAEGSLPVVVRRFHGVRRRADQTVMTAPAHGDLVGGQGKRDAEASLAPRSGIHRRPVRLAAIGRRRK